MNLVMLTALAASHAAALWDMRRLMRGMLNIIGALTEEWVEFPQLSGRYRAGSG